MPGERQLEIIKNVLTEDFLVNDDSTGGTDQYSPSISMDGSGNFVIVWEDYRNGNFDIYFQRYNSSGTEQGVNRKANDDDGTAGQDSPSISMDGSGNFVIVWIDFRNYYDYDSDFYYQRYNSNGEAQGINTKAIIDDAGSARQYDPTIAMEGSGNFVIAWQDYRNGNSDIYYQRYNSSGTAQGVNTKANDDVVSAYQFSPSISMDGSDNFVIAWQDYRNGNSDIYYQRYNSSGTAQGVNTKANDDVVSAYQWSPSISMDSSGNFVIVWEDYRNGDYDSDIYYQRYNSSGTAQGVNTKANDDAGSAYQYSPSISMDGSGNFVIVWIDDRNVNSDIYYQRYNSSGTAQGVNTKANDDDGSADQLYPSISMDGSGNFVIVWTDERDGISDIYFQRYNSSGTTQV
ncbi:MAG: hypothetical protein IPH11_01145 [Ignavibacteriales bacterium]|nr:hypothetical protein [Ignavibacteriales bacterium]